MTRTSILIISVLVLCAFQNCSGVNFTDGFGASSLSKSAREEGEDANGEQLQNECRKLQSMEIGQEITIDGVKITIRDLTYKSDSGVGGEKIGFELTSNSSEISFLVKAGGEGYAGTGKSWINPNGTEGPEVSAISHVTLCVGIPPQEIIDPSLPWLREAN